MRPRSVTIATVASDAPAWIVVYDGDGALGLASLARGRHAGVEVGLGRRVGSTETLRAALHVDGGELGVFDPAEDDPVLAGGAPVEASFSVTPADDAPAVRLTISAIGDRSYVFREAEPSLYAVADPSVENPPIVLRRGWRYEVFNPSNVHHPFELVREVPGDLDEVHLSQRVVGTLHDDPSVAFETVTPAIFRFTVSPSFEAAIDTYRCLVHEPMRGSVSYATEP